jgi:hypothetical protein
VVNEGSTMNKPDFAPILAAFREQDERREQRRKWREKWLARPLNERESVIFDNLLYCIDRREEVSEFKRDDVVADVHDYWASAEGQADLGELLYHVYEENRSEARECLDKVIRVLAKIRYEDEV